MQNAINSCCHNLTEFGQYATNHPLFLGMGGMHGSYAANIAMTDADFMIAIGCRFDDRLTGNPKTFAKNAKVVHIDVDPAEIGKVLQWTFQLLVMLSKLLKCS